MCRFNFLALIITLILGAKAHALVGDSARTEVGVGYLTWNEKFSVHNTTDNAGGTAAYGGVAAYIEQSWMIKKWQFGLNFSVGGGKASATASSGTATYKDGTNRSWTAEVIEPFVRYAINHYVLLGGGLRYRQTQITWDTADTTLALQPSPKGELTGEFDFKIELSKQWSVAQSYAPIGWGGHSEWFTSVGFAF